MTGDGASETAAAYYETQEKLQEKREELSTARAEVFATDSREVEQRARELFEDLGADTDGGRIRRIDELEAEIAELRDEVEALERELWEHLEELRLPFERSIESRDGEVGFAFSDSLSEPLVRAISDTHPEAPESVDLRTEEIAVETDEVGEAISAVEGFLTATREAVREKTDSKSSEDGSGSSGFLGSMRLIVRFSPTRRSGRRARPISDRPSNHR